ncbi:zinc-binding alcohol dehydrogenase family protein [Microbacterium sp. NPDC091313]
MARHWVATAPGAPDTWSFEETAVPAPGPGEVTIRVRAAGVNPADYKHVAQQRPGQVFPVPIGYEVSGELTAVGPDTAIASGACRVGDEVVAFRVQGGYATDLTVSADLVLHKPAALEHAAAANLLLAGTTAAEMIAVTSAAAGETVLLHAAAGAVGVSALQQAAVRGIRVIGTVGSDASAQRVRGFGGVPVRYGDGLADRVRDAVGGARVAAAWDAAGTEEAVSVSLDLVADRQRIVTIANTPAAEREGFRWIAGARPESARFRTAARPELIALAEQGRLTVPVARTFPLADAVAALRFVAEGHPGGTVALLPRRALSPPRAAAAPR